MFPMINLEETGKNIKHLMKLNDVKVKELQDYFGFRTPQAVYKWTKGICVPNIDNLVALAQFFDCKIDDIIVIDY